MIPFLGMGTDQATMRCVGDPEMEDKESICGDAGTGKDWYKLLS